MDLGSLSPALILSLVVSLALAPYMAVMVTAFTKLVVVFSLLRNAMGLQQTPPNIVLNGLAIVLSAYVMYPVALHMMDEAKKASLLAQPQVSEQLGEQVGEQVGEQAATMPQLLEVAALAREPLRAFLVEHTAESERAFFARTARRLLPQEKRGLIGDEDLIVVVPAFTVSELSRAFQIGFVIFLPFLVIDLVVANILQALGMMMLSPTTISMPFKLLLFVVLDGWSKLIHGLVLTY